MVEADIRIRETDHLRARQGPGQFADTQIRFLACHDIHHLIEGPRTAIKPDIDLELLGNRLGKINLQPDELALLHVEERGCIHTQHGNNEFTPVDDAGNAGGQKAAVSHPDQGGWRRGLLAAGGRCRLQRGMCEIGPR